MKTRSCAVFIATLTLLSFEAAWARPNQIVVNEAPQSLHSLDADSAFKELISGNQRFVTGHVRTQGQSQADRQRLSKGQAPNSVVISCSDSRVPPEAVFDQKLGEMFTVRSAGETLSPQAIASAEFAVENLGSRLIVILGHTNCGAVKATIDTAEGESAGSPNLDQLVSDIRPRIKAELAHNHASKDLRAESLLNAKGVASDLLKRSPLIAKAVQTNKVKIRVGLYDLENGSVEFQP